MSAVMLVLVEHASGVPRRACLDLGIQATRIVDQVRHEPAQRRKGHSKAKAHRAPKGAGELLRMSANVGRGGLHDVLRGEHHLEDT